MKLRSLLLYLMGYVIIEVTGTVEKFINLCISRGINLLDLRSLSSNKISFKISLNDFWVIRHIIKKTDCTIKILDKKGFPFYWSKTKKRKLLVIGSIFFVIVIYTLSNFIWFIEVTSYEDLEHVDKEKVIEIAKNIGLKPGAYKRSINIENVEKNIIKEIPNISWVGLEFQGTRAILEIVERKIPNEDYNDKQPKHIVAKKNGIIDEILVMAGQAMVKVGDTVEKDQILISGEIIPEKPEISEGTNDNLEIPNQQIQLGKARGIVRARVWYEGQATVNLQDTIEERTGAKEIAYFLNLRDKKLVIKGSLDSSFQNYDSEYQTIKIPKIKQFSLPLEIVKITRYELDISEKKFSKEEAISIAVSTIKKNLKLPENVKILEEETRLMLENDKQVMVKLVIETIEDITKAVPIDYVKYFFIE